MASLVALLCPPSSHTILELEENKPCVGREAMPQGLPTDPRMPRYPPPPL